MSIQRNSNHFWFRPETNGISIIYFLIMLSVFPFAASQGNNAPPSPNPNPYGLSTNFNPSMAIIIIVLISAFFFMGFFSIYIRQCAGERRDGSVRPTNATGGRSRRAARGLDPAVIETFPTFIYSVVKGLKIGKGALECAVCLNEFEDDETLRLLPKCDHVFHPECIDAWLVSHTTCPVCRANLAAESGETTTGDAAATQVPDSDSESSDVENRTSETADAENHVSISVIDDQHRDSQPEVINPTQIPFQNRPVRSRSTRQKFSGKFPRSHSTGHSLIQPGENCERFTLRLPEEIRKQIVNGKLNRTTSCVSFPSRYGTGGSSRRGYRGSTGGEGSSRGKYSRFWRLDSRARSDRWAFSIAPPFFSRNSSVRSPRKIDGEGSSSKKILTSVMTPFDCLAAKVDGKEQSSSRPPV